MSQLGGPDSQGANIMPRGKKAAATDNGAKISKLEATRRAVSKLGRDVTTNQLSDFLKSEYQIEMSPKMVATCKGTALKQLGRNKPGPKPGRERVVTSVPVSASPANGEAEITVDDIRAVKAVVDKAEPRRCGGWLEFLAS
jgi:hypothetical protein